MRKEISNEQVRDRGADFPWGCRFGQWQLARWSIMHGWSGAVGVEVFEHAVPQLHGCHTKGEVLAACDDGTLSTQLQRVNVRGVLRQDARGKARKFVAEINMSPRAYIFVQAMRASLGLAQTMAGVVVAAR